MISDEEIKRELDHGESPWELSLDVIERLRSAETALTELIWGSAVDGLDKARAHFEKLKKGK